MDDIELAREIKGLLGELGQAGALRHVSAGLRHLDDRVLSVSGDERTRMLAATRDSYRSHLAAWRRSRARRQAMLCALPFALGLACPASVLLLVL